MYHANITEDHLNACDFHVNNYRYATGFLPKNFRSSSPAIWHENDSLINIFKLNYRKPKFTIENVNLPLSHSVHPPFVSAGMTVGEGGEVEPPTKFSKEGGCWERGGLQLLHKIN